jgi:hypothetical protein
MIGCRVVNGSMGNAMFFIATAIAHSKKNNAQFVIEDTVKSLQPLFNYDFTPHHIPYHVLRTLPPYTDPAFNFSPIPDSNHLFLNYGPGYYQSYRYFDEIKDELKTKYFAPSEDTITCMIGKAAIGYGKDCAALHIRRGDYLKFPHHPVLPMDYYRKAINLIPEAKRILVFSNDPHWCQQNFNFDDRLEVVPAIVMPHDGSVDDNWNWMNGVDLFMMAKFCKWHIIANSSYSWWGAYLSDSERVIYPSGWFDGPLLKHNTKDMCPPDWIKL